MRNLKQKIKAKHRMSCQSHLKKHSMQTSSPGHSQHHCHGPHFSKNWGNEMRMEWPSEKLGGPIERGEPYV